MHGSHADFLARIQLGLGFFYLLLAAMNWVAALLLWRDGPKPYFKLGGITVNKATRVQTLITIPTARVATVLLRS